MEPRRLTLGLIVGLGTLHCIVFLVGSTILFAVWVATDAYSPCLSHWVGVGFCLSWPVCGLSLGALTQLLTRRGALAGAAVGAAAGVLSLVPAATARMHCGADDLLFALAAVVSCTLGAYLAQLVQQRRQRIPRSATQEGCTADRPPSP
jgi:hypothetical protein